MFGKRKKLEAEMMEEIKAVAGVDDFPWEDANALSKLIATYNRGDNQLITMACLGSMDILEKYPELCSEWDNIMIKYHELGLFPKWKI